MREISSGNPNTRILVIDEPGAGGANHEYALSFKEGERKSDFGFVKFQNGPIIESGVNGCHQEDLLSIVIDRLRSFQSGPFKCRENALALTKCEEALHWLNHRTAERIKRGVEGKNLE